MAQIWAPDKIVHVDREGDRERASDGYSRYGSYVGAREDEFKDTWSRKLDAPLEPIAFAIAAWRIATPPVMSPGLVDCRPDLHVVDVGYDEDGTCLAVSVQLPLRHAELAAKIPYAYDDWSRVNHWSHSDYSYLEMPRVRCGHPAVTALATIRHIPQITLVTPGPPTGQKLVDDCLQSVELTAAAINAELPEIIRNVLGEKP
ncbi:hypothetical protein ACFPC0_11020 [Streptomyces andamanensis]|uniref:Uncharacterized protein n=1 Tax=Streptomyces andamanensis TaxID=1565035 RepID=A0ABV8TCP1_9ACTN